jgi:hypothetical protein
VHPVGETTLPNLPEPRELRIEATEESIDILEFLQIRRCDLQRLVAERNSSLGKLAMPSQRLVYELNFLRLGEQCEQAIAQDYPDLSQTLREVLELKRQNLPGQIFQATLGAKEFRSFWQQGNELPAQFEEDGALIIALSQLADDVERWQSGSYQIDSTRFESQLDLIRRANVGRQLQAWMVLSNRIDVATRVVKDRLERAPLCHEGMQPPRAQILDTVVRTVLIGRIQPWAAGLSTRYFEIFPRIRRLEDLLAGVSPVPYQDWRHVRDSRLDRATESLARHVKALNPLFEQCNLLPQRDNQYKGAAR